jgi:hypothetical protein
VNQLIRDIIKEEVSANKDKFQRKVLDVLSKEGFNGATSYEVILQFLNTHLAIKGMEAFEIYQLHKDNWRTFDSEPDLIRKDISKTKIKTANIRGRELVLNKIPFKGSNTHSKYYDNGSYVVFSYDWYPIYLHKDGQWLENEDGYSMSTKKQMSQLRPYGQGDIIKTSKDKLWDIIKKK